MLRLSVIIIASIILAIPYNMFLQPHNILSGGVAGIAMIFGILTPIKTGTMIFLLNLPIFIVGYIKLGRKFIINSLISVIITSVTMNFIPIRAIAEDQMLSAIFGGVIIGICVGTIFRFSGSTGGFDIIGMILTKERDFPLGALIFSMNAIVVLISGALFSWELALYTMLTIYTTGRVIDMIHTRHVKLTLMIITNKGEEVKERLLSKLTRGITIVDGEGGYTHEKRKILFTVITRYELAEVKPLIQEIDPKAFVNITETVEVMGSFKIK